MEGDLARSKPMKQTHSSLNLQIWRFPFGLPTLGPKARSPSLRRSYRASAWDGSSVPHLCSPHRTSCSESGDEKGTGGGSVTAELRVGARRRVDSSLGDTEREPWRDEGFRGGCVSGRVKGLSEEKLGF